MARASVSCDCIVCRDAQLYPRYEVEPPCESRRSRTGARLYSNRLIVEGLRIGTCLLARYGSWFDTCDSMPRSMYPVGMS